MSETNAAHRLQPALDRHHYVDAASFEREAEMLRREWTCIGRLDDLGLAASGSIIPNRRAVLSYLGESVIVTADADGSLHAFANVCRHRGSQVVPVEPGVAGRALLTRNLCGVRITPGPTASTAGCCMPPTPTTSIWTPRPSDCSRCAPRPGADSSGSPRIWKHLLSSTRSVRCRTGCGAIRSTPSCVGMRLTYSVAANWKVIAENYNECYHCGPVHPELSRLVPAFGGGGTDLEWEDGIPHRDGAWTFTMSGTTDRAPFPDLDDAERVRHKGELVYPNLLLSLSAEHVAAFVLRPAAVDRTEITCDLLFAPDEAAKPGFDPSDAAESLGSGQPAGLGDLRVGAARNDVAVLHAGLVRADGGRVRWTSAAGCSPGSSGHG